MNRKYTSFGWMISGGLLFAAFCSAGVLPSGDSPPAIEFMHFPDRLHTFVWRNWELVSLDRMAAVVGTTPENIRSLGESMGLPPHVTPPEAYQRLGYISIIRRNWHILPYEQLLTLLNWDAEKLAFTLREDDFLWIKLGSLKPSCPVLFWVPQDESAKERCAEIRAVVSAHFKDLFDRPFKLRFDFFKDTLTREIPVKSTAFKESNEPIRFLYSYSGVFGDPLLEPELDPYPDELLKRLSVRGVNGVWLHIVLRQLAPSTIFPEFGKDHEIRIKNLRQLAKRASNYGIKVYLYLNEPRAMPEPFFKGREDMKGIRQGDHCAICTSNSEVQTWLKESLCYVFKQVPELGGVFTITASENLTNCYSQSRDAAGCPRCSVRSGPEVIAEVNRTIAAGVWEGNPDAAVIVWDWGWPDGTDAGWGRPDWTAKIIEALPENVYLMSVSEWGKPIERGGISSIVGEYSISAIGPGPRAQKQWAQASKRGLKTIAKVQVNSSWELSAVPFLPVMNTVAQHCDNLTKMGIDGLMLSWTVGGYPSPNLDVVRQFQSKITPTIQQALTSVARSRYGIEAAEDVLFAWSEFSKAFDEYPFHIQFVYTGPAQYGPSNLLYPVPTGYRATMIGFPYDDVGGWCGAYPADILAGQFEKMASGWQKGLSAFEKVLSGIPGTHSEQAEQDQAIAKAVYLHFKSVANQIRFTLARNALQAGSLDEQQEKAQVAAIKAVVQDEIVNAKALFVLTRGDPRIGFEASNQYYYLPLDLVEKVVDCDYILSKWIPEQTAATIAPVK
ncbi:MAG: hypothetical protein JXB18_00010 [Sedimentisphaerales bacterium]|nr:hypothetical protein [Sedimentisphaerales bacterium]